MSEACEVCVVNATSSIIIHSLCVIEEDERLDHGQTIIRPRQMCRYLGSEGAETYIYDTELEMVHTVEFTQPGEPHVIVVRNHNGVLQCDNYFLWKSGFSMLPPPK